MKEKTNKTWTDEQLIEAVKISNTYQEVSRKLGHTTYGANSRTIKKHIARLKLDTSHFMSTKEILEYARSHMKKPLSYDELFSINEIDRKHIKKYIIDNKIIPYRCHMCNIVDTWNGNPISLHLDHINGVNNDNRLENLRFLCPNCHSQTNSYCGKNIAGKLTVEHRCIDCNIQVANGSTRCKPCASKHKNSTKIVWPKTSILVQLVEEHGYAETGRKLGVSDNAVKKRIRNHPDD